MPETSRTAKHSKSASRDSAKLDQREDVKTSTNVGAQADAGDADAEDSVDGRRTSFGTIMDEALKTNSGESMSDCDLGPPAHHDIARTLSLLRQKDGNVKYFDPNIRPSTLSSTSSQGIGSRRQSACPSVLNDREEKTRERKLRDLRSKRASVASSAPVSATGEYRSRDSEQKIRLDLQDAASTIKKAKQATRSEKNKPTTTEAATACNTRASSPDFRTGYTPRSTFSSRSPAVKVAEKVPLPRGRQQRRPARLVLPVQTASQQLAIAVTDGTTSGAPKRDCPLQITLDVPTLAKQLRDIPTPDLERSSLPEALQPEGKVDEGMRSEPEKVDHVAVYKEAPAGKDSISPTDYPHLEPSPIEAVGTKTSTSPIQPNKPQAPPAVPQRSSLRLTAFPAPPQQVQRGSICSSLTSSTKESRLEARVEVLERENRLLEAALMAVLKTGGQLNGCPCGLGVTNAVRRKSKHRSKAAAILSGAEPVADDATDSNRTWPPKAGKCSDKTGNDAEEQAVVGEQAPKRRLSPLSVYLETRAHGLVGSLSALDE